MPSIYHLVPEKMVGSRLVPLNEMKVSAPDIYSQAVRKYQDRETILTRRIPKIDCLWNDVLHFSSIDPNLIFARLQELGFGTYHHLRWYEVPVRLISDIPSVVYRAPPKPRFNFALDDSDVEWFDQSNWQEPTSLSAETGSYFEACKAEDKVPLLFQFTPHVLVRGQIDVANLKITSMHSVR